MTDDYGFPARKAPTSIGGLTQAEIPDTNRTPTICDAGQDKAKHSRVSDLHSVPPVDIGSGGAAEDSERPIIPASHHIRAKLETPDRKKPLPARAIRRIRKAANALIARLPKPVRGLGARLHVEVAASARWLHFCGTKAKTIYAQCAERISTSSGQPCPENRARRVALSGCRIALETLSNTCLAAEKKGDLVAATVTAQELSILSRWAEQLVANQSKGIGLDLLPEDWDHQIFHYATAPNKASRRKGRRSKYVREIALCSVAGVRPAEIQGTIVELTEEGFLKVRIPCAKSRQKIRPLRTQVWPVETPMAQYLRDAVLATPERRIVFQMPNPVLISDVLKGFSRVLWPTVDYQVTAMSFRHQLSSDLKAMDGIDREDIAKAMGHTWDETQNWYAPPRHGGRFRPRPVSLEGRDVEPATRFRIEKMLEKKAAKAKKLSKQKTANGMNAAAVEENAAEQEPAKPGF